MPGFGNIEHDGYASVKQGKEQGSRGGVLIECFRRKSKMGNKSENRAKRMRKKH